MVWKTGKFGVNSGKTVRSRRSHSKRSEGLLIQTTVRNDFSKEKQDGGESITYSLGKQNRWLLPEVIKASSFEEAEFLHGEELVLVERFSNLGKEKRRRPDCFSVFDSSNRTTRKSKRRLARAEDLLSDIKSMKTRYEVAYPHPAGSWAHDRESSTKKQRTHLGSRKKNTFLSRSIEEDLSEISEAETLFHVDEDDFINDDQSHSSKVGVSLTFDLESLICDSLYKRKNSLKTKNGPLQVNNNKEHKETKFRKGDAIYVESGDEMYGDAHEKFLAMVEEMQPAVTESPYMDDWHYYYQPAPVRGRGGGHGRGRGRGRGGLYHGYRNGRSFAEETMPSSSWPVESTEPFVTAVEPVKPVEPIEVPCQWVSLVLDHQDINPGFLEKKWGSNYKEAACFPRAFVISVTPPILHSCSKELFVLLQLAKDASESDAAKVEARICPVVISNDENSNELVQREFISQIKAKSGKTEIWSLKDVVDIAKICFLKNITDETELKEPRESRFSLGVFTELFGWKSKALSLEAARQEMKKSCMEKIKHKSQELATMATADYQHQTECAICFMPFEYEDPVDSVSHTSLISCGHKFCNDCWRGHLKTQIQLGQTDLSCPGHKCTDAVDDVTLMSLLPTWYGKFVTKKLDKFLEIHPSWKWCPEDQCNLVVKATTPQNITDVCDAHVGTAQPVPVVCVCGSMWCFKCQEDAHWPATCEEAKTFRENTKGYAKMVARSQTSPLITSVQIKNCPFCHYPIQKGPGCNHMGCSLCHKEFCWFCLDEWSWVHSCKEKVEHQEVELPISTKYLRSYEHFAVTSRMARSTSVIRSIHMKLEKLDKGLNSYGKLPPEVRRDTAKSGRAKKDLNYLVENNALDVLREVFSFKFQAVLAVEGLAMVLSFTRDAPNKSLEFEFDRMVFIVERMDDMLKDFNKCYRKETLERLKLLVKFGKQSLIVISKNKK